MEWVKEHYLLKKTTNQTWKIRRGWQRTKDLPGSKIKLHKHRKSADLLKELEFTEHPAAPAIHLGGNTQGDDDALALGLPADPSLAVLAGLTSFHSDLWRFAKPLKDCSKKRSLKFYGFSRTHTGTMEL